MSLGIYMSMPILILNLSGEMMYILEQRFVSQKINKIKIAKGIYM